MKRLPFLVLAAWLFTACSGSSLSCAGMTPIPGGQFTGPRADDPIQARISARGFQTLNAQQQQLLGIIAPGSTMNVPVPCSITSASVLGNLVIADQGSAGCLLESCGLMDGQCTSADVPVTIPVTFTNLVLAPSPPQSIAATVDVQFSTGKLYVDSVNRSHAVCLFSGGGPMKCGVDYDSRRTPPLDNQIVATVELTVDLDHSQRIAMNLKKVDGLAVCGGPGALPSPQCTQNSDLILTSEVGGCCPGNQSSFVKDLLLTFIADKMKQQLQTAVENQTCEPCAFGSCPVEEDGGTSTCDFARGICVNQTLGRCVPRRAGVEGRLDPAALLTGLPGTAQVDISLMMAHRAAANTGLELGSRGGAQSVTTTECVPFVPEPAFAASSPVNFDANNDGGYELGLSISRGYLDRVGYGLHQSGGFCGVISSATYAQVNTGFVRAFLPSLGKILGPEDTPMRLLLRPQAPPTFTIGAGTFDPVTKAVIEPLMKVNLQDFRIEFHVMIDDRYVRLLTATVDATLPFSLIPDGCGRVLPVVGDLNNVVTNVRFSESEIVAEELDTALGPLLPAIVSFAQPMLSGNLAAMNVPAVGPFKVDLLEAKGVNPLGNGAFDHAALFTKLVPTTHCVAPPPPMFKAHVVSVETKEKTRPVVRVKLDAPAEASFRVDDGLWSTFAKTDGELAVTHPLLMLQGPHRIEVRVRRNASEASTLLPPMSAKVDLEAPYVRLVREDGRVVTKAYDSVTPLEQLKTEYRFGDGAYREQAPRAFTMNELETLGGVTVRVTDESGRSTEATLPKLTTADHEDLEQGRDECGTGAGGCSAAPGASFLLLALLALTGARRRGAR